MDPDTAALLAKVAGRRGLEYIAPERSGRMDRVPDQRADLYSLGAIYYELLTGTPPFPRADSIDLVHAHLARAPAPPSQVNPLVPQVLSQIVLRLLAKMPEQRYQSAQALLGDLHQARARLLPDGSIRAFELGQGDLVSELPLPTKLYGRDDEVAELRGAWAAVLAGASRVVLLRGEAGNGKSTLARALERLVVDEAQGRFVSGKFHIRQSHVLYAPLVEALGALVRGLLELPEGERANRASAIRDALGRNAGVISALIPDLSRLIGEPPPVGALDTVGTQNRFEQVFLAFLRSLLEHQPLVLFLDDLQWVDVASLRLIRLLVAAPELKRLLFLGAFRSEAVGPEHPLARGIQGLREAGLEIRQIDVLPLGFASVNQLCADALHADPHDGVRSLSEVLVRKTAGNPLFLERFFRFLQKTGRLQYDSDAARWIWDLAAVESVAVTDNMADLLIAALHRLPAPVRAVLGAAAPIGGSIPLPWLAVACDQPPQEIVAAARSAVSEGYLVARSGESADDVRFEFAHDWLLQACGGLLSEAERQALHLRLGRHLLSTSRPDEQRTGLDHLNLAAAAISDPSERLQLCRMNHLAATRARASSAYAQALAHLQGSLAFLPEDAWHDHPTLAYEVHRDALECALVCNDTKLAEQLFRTASSALAAARDKADLIRVRVDASMRTNAAAEAVNWARQGLEILGIAVPAPDDAATGAAELETAMANLASGRLEGVPDGPAMEDDGLECAMRLLASMVGPTYTAGSPLFPFVVGRMLNLSLAHGNSATSATGFVLNGMRLACQDGSRALAHRFGQVALALARRFGDPAEDCRTRAAVEHIIAPLGTPVRDVVLLMRETHRQALECGDLNFGWSSLGGAAMMLFHQGVELPRALQVLEEAEAASRRNNVVGNAVTLGIYGRHLRRLQGPTREGTPPGVDAMDDEAFVRQLNSQHTGTYHALRLASAYLLGDMEGAWRHFLAGRQPLVRPRLLLHQVDHALYGGLTLAARHQQASADEQPSLRAALAAEVDRLCSWADSCPENFRHRHLLLLAEQAHIEGRELDALPRYDEAIEAAARERFLPDEALANELAGRFHRRHGRERFASVYLRAARDLYRQWGAGAKVEALDEEYPEYGDDWSPAGAAGARVGVEADGTGGASLDLEALFRAAEAISREVVLARLLDKLMEICLATTGAERGALLLAEEDGLSLRARRFDQRAHLAPSRAPGGDRPGPPPDGGGGGRVLLATGDSRRREASPVRRRSLRPGQPGPLRDGPADLATGPSGRRALPREQPGHPGLHPREGAPAAAAVLADRDRAGEQPPVRAAHRGGAGSAFSLRGRRRAG